MTSSSSSWSAGSTTPCFERGLRRRSQPHASWFATGVREGDVISLRERSQNLSSVDAALEDVRLARPDWIEFDEGKKTATIKSLPKVDSVPFPLEIDLVIEYYSKRL